MPKRVLEQLQAQLEGEEREFEEELEEDAALAEAEGRAGDRDDSEGGEWARQGEGQEGGGGGGEEPSAAAALSEEDAAEAEKWRRIDEMLEGWLVGACVPLGAVNEWQAVCSQAGRRRGPCRRQRAAAV